MDINPIKEKKRIEKDRELVFEDSIKNRDARDLGTEWLCYQAIKQLCLEEFLQREGWSEKDIQLTVAHLITRTVYHSSEYKSLRIMQENAVNYSSDDYKMNLPQTANIIIGGETLNPAGVLVWKE